MWSMTYCAAQEQKILRRTSADAMATWSAPRLLSGYSASAKNFSCPFPLQPVPASNAPGKSGQLRLTFSPIIAGRTYAVKYCTDLASGAWLPLISPTQTDNGVERSVTDYNAAGPRKFYRVETTLP